VKHSPDPDPDALALEYAAWRHRAGLEPTPEAALLLARCWRLIGAEGWVFAGWGREE
jgi:hypothetical protein